MPMSVKASYSHAMLLMKRLLIQFPNPERFFVTELAHKSITIALEVFYC